MYDQATCSGTEGLYAPFKSSWSLSSSASAPVPAVFQIRASVEEVGIVVVAVIMAVVSAVRVKSAVVVVVVVVAVAVVESSRRKQS